MFKLDNDFLTSLGLGGLPVDEKNKLLQMIYERLEMNVGMRLAEKMSDQQLDEFESFIDQNDEAGALKWLETNFPNYKDVVAEELEKLRVEVTQSAPQILAAQGGGQPQPAMMTEPQMPGVPQPQAMPASAPAQQPVFQQTATPAMQQPMYDQPMQHMQQPQAMPTPGYMPQQPAPQPFISQEPPMQQPSLMMQPSTPAQQPTAQPLQPYVPNQPAPAPTQDMPMQMPIQPQPAQPQPMQPAPGFMPLQTPQPAPGFTQPQQPVQPQQFTPPPSFGQ